jgi:hypothetical protein
VTIVQYQMKKIRASRIKPKVKPAVRVECAYDKLVDTARLRPNPANPHRHPEAQVDKLAKLIAAHGWRHPVTVSNRSGFIVAGHCRLLAAQKLKLAQVPVDYQDFASEAEEMAVLVADNVVQEFGEIDGLKMADILCDLDQADYSLELTALDPDQIKRYIEGPTSTPKPESKENKHECPKCGYQW